MPALARDIAHGVHCRLPRRRLRCPAAAASAPRPAELGAPLNVLVVGGGGREHALVVALRRSPCVDALFVAPGNAGTAAEPRVASLPREALDTANHGAVVAFCLQKGVGLVVVGPEAPLVAGLADALTAAGVPVCGPSAAAARLEGSKAFMKGVAASAGVPTASHAVFSDADAAKAYITARGAPVVVKADGLAAGKGVVVAATLAEACDAVDSFLVRRTLGDAGARVVVEEFLEGEEASFFALVGTDGVAEPLGACQDHKAVGEGDVGPNTGGMGAYSPTPIVTPALAHVVMDTLVRPTVDAMASAGCPFSGILFAGLMVSPAGGVKLLEYNVRLGDPEAQALLPRFTGDLAALLLGAATGRTREGAAFSSWAQRSSLCVVVASVGYPGAFATGDAIRGLDAASASGCKVYHAGTRAGEGGGVVSAGGRVLGVTGTGGSIAAAAQAAYAGVDSLDWPGGFCRRDIGWRAIAKEEKEAVENPPAPR